jgi:hypothetical protein
MSYNGNDRRRRCVYTTRNTEYHVFDGVCVGVRDRITSTWRERHSAIRTRLEGGMRVFANGAVVPTLRGPEVGDPIYFDVTTEKQVVTSKLVSIDRPERVDLKRYCAA